MMESFNLKTNHPQKFYLKILCRIMFYMGMGDCWYEKNNFSGFWKKFYKFWACLSNSFIVIILCDEFLAYVRNDLSEKEKTDLQQFSFAHPSIVAKIITIYINKDVIKRLLERLLEGTRSTFKCLELEEESVKQFMMYCFALFASSYLTLTSASIEAIRIHFKEDVPVRTEIVLYPTTSNSGIFVNILRFLIEFHWYLIVTMMVIVDSLTLCSLVIVRHKFKVLQMYFQELGSKMESSVFASRREIEETFEKQFIVGMHMHQDALWCAQHMQHSLGPIYSIQVFESVILLVMCLIKLVAGEHNLTYLLASLAYFTCLIVITGAYMMAAGDITYEAALVPTSIFHCGWQCATPRARTLAVVALQRGQVPVEMTAFGIITLTYSTFISVLRFSYSFFAVMY